VAIEYAARHPDKVSHLALYGACSYGWAYQSEAHRQEWERLLGLTKDGWGQEHPDYQRAFIDKFKPEATADQKFCLMRLQEASTRKTRRRSKPSGGKLTFANTSGR